MLNNNQFNASYTDNKTLKDLTGKELTSNDFTDSLKLKLDTLQEGVGGVNADWNSTSGGSEILNKPKIPTLTTEITDTINKRYQTDNQQSFNDATSSIQTQLNDKQPLDATLTELASLNSTTGFIAQTGADTFSKRIITGSSGIDVTNGSGDVANPIITPNYGALSNTIAQGDDARLGTKAIDETNIANNRIQVYNSTSGKLEYQDKPTGGGNVSATSINGATNKALISLNDTATSLGLITTAAQKQSFAKSIGGIVNLTTTEVNSLTWTQNDVIFNTTNKKFLRYTSSANWVDANASIGEYKKLANSVEEFGWLKCIGQNVSRTTYAELFSAIGTAFGSGDGSTTFTLPDFRSSVFGDIGKKTTLYSFAPTNVNISTDVITLASISDIYTGTPIVFSTTGTLPGGITAGTTYYATRNAFNNIKISSSLSNVNNGSYINISSQGTGSHTATVSQTNRALGYTIGEEEHFLTENEIPAHNHSYTRYGTILNNFGAGFTDNILSSTTSTTTGSAGGTQVHNNMQPTLFGGSTFIFTGV